MTETTLAWRRRYMTEQLGTGYELWNLTRPQPAVHARLAAIHARLGRSPSAEDIAYMLVDFLLPEAINAAEGVERSYRAARHSAARAQAALEDSMANHPELYANVGAPHRHGWADETVTAFWYELINMIIWTRSLDDRIRRSGVRVDRDQGLLPSLAPSGLRDSVSGAYGQLVSGHLAEVRHLANYSVHGGIFQTPGTPNSEVVGGRLLFVMPDPIARAVDHWYEFTFRQRRDAVVFADELFSEVSRFMNKLLDAFSQAVPVRFRGA